MVAIKVLAAFISKADAHRDDGKRYVVRADEKLTAFLELEAAIWASRELPDSRTES